MLDWPASVPRTAAGHPAGPETVSALKDRGVKALIFLTDGGLFGVDGRILFAQLTSTGKVVGLVAMDDSGALGASAGPVAQALGQGELRAFRLEDDGLNGDDGLAEVFERYLVRDLDKAPDSEQRRFGLALDLGTGFGVATGVTDPGVAPTPFFVRPDIFYAVGESFELGVSARVQVVDFAFLAEPYLRWKIGVTDLRMGVAIGEIRHKIVITENRKSSVSGLAGPALSLELPLGNLRVGAGLLAPLFPDPTLQVDFWVGLEL
jgi:hypothetical protein